MFNLKLFSIILFYSSNQKLTLAQQQLQTDYEKLKTEEAEKSGKLQDLMSVHVLDYKRSVPSSDNKSTYNLTSTPILNLKRPKCEAWAEFIPYRKARDSKTKCCQKSRKETLNNLAKLAKNSEYMSVFHIHTLHLHLFISLTLILVTHKCPQYLVVI